MHRGRIRRASIVLATCAALLLGGSGANAVPKLGASNATSQESKSTNEDSKRNAVVRAVDEAFRGENSRLEALLNGPQSAAVQQELRSRLEARGDFQRVEVPEPTDADLTPMATGEYDNYCTGYNGVTMGWYEKEILACHGWLDSYISGRHVAHL